jgi:UDP-glucose 4,6-dehydratase
MSKRKADAQLSSNGKGKGDADAVAVEYVPKVIMLTGGAGFIGSNVMLHIVKKYPQYRMVCYDKLDYCATTNNFKEIADHPNFKFVKGDITTVDMVNHVIESEGVDTIMHFAAQTHVDNSFGNSFLFTHANVMGTHVLLEAAKKFQSQVRRFIHVSTDEVYGESPLDKDAVAFDEMSALSPTNPYAATKAAAEFMVKSYRKSFGLPTIITRGNNVYGPRQYPEKLIPKFITLLSQNKPVPVHGTGNNRRSFLHVDDVATAFDLVLHRGQLGNIYNIGTEYEISNLEVTKTLIDAMGMAKREKELITFVEDRKFNDVRYHISVDKLAQLGWSPQVEFLEGLKRTIAWYKANPNQYGDVSGALVAHPRVGLGAQH